MANSQLRQQVNNELNELLNELGYTIMLCKKVAFIHGNLSTHELTYKPYPRDEFKSYNWYIKILNVSFHSQREQNLMCGIRCNFVTAENYSTTGTNLYILINKTKSNRTLTQSNTFIFTLQILLLVHIRDCVSFLNCR